MNSLKILLTDDNMDTRLLYKMGFEMMGHEVHLAGDGREAVAAVQEHDFDVVVMDLEMPIMNGWDAIAAIRVMEKGRNLPIVILSAYFTVAYEERVQREKVDMVLSKPIMPNELGRLLEKLVASKSTKTTVEIAESHTM